MKGPTGSDHHKLLIFNIIPTQNIRYFSLKDSFWYQNGQCKRSKLLFHDN